MESYVTSEKNVVQRTHLNSVFKQMYNYLNSFENKETTQDYSTAFYCGVSGAFCSKDYNGPVVLNVGSTCVWVGNNLNGVYYNEFCTPVWCEDVNYYELLDSDRNWRWSIVEPRSSCKSKDYEPIQCFCCYTSGVTMNCVGQKWVEQYWNVSKVNSYPVYDDQGCYLYTEYNYLEEYYCYRHYNYTACVDYNNASGYVYGVSRK